jgi:ketosteroid isomerase-like protein
MGEVTRDRKEIVREIWRVYEREGEEAGLEALLECCHPDAVFELYTAGDVVLKGADEMRDFLRRRAEEGAIIEARVHRIAEEGDTVIVRGGIRVRRPGRLADAQVCWRYTFDGDRIASTRYRPLESADAA